MHSRVALSNGAYVSFSDALAAFSPRSTTYTIWYPSGKGSLAKVVLIARARNPITVARKCILVIVVS
jgi:hypothetical protein